MKKTINFDEHECPGVPTSRIEVARFRPDFENPGSFPKQESRRIQSEELPGFWYLNPVTLVASPEETDEFLQAVMKTQAAWFRLLSREFKSGWRLIRKQADYWTQAYEFDGVVVREGSIVPFKLWREFL